MRPKRVMVAVDRPLYLLIRFSAQRDDRTVASVVRQAIKRYLRESDVARN